MLNWHVRNVTIKEQSGMVIREEVSTSLKIKSSNIYFFYFSIPDEGIMVMTRRLYHTRGSFYNNTANAMHNRYNTVLCIFLKHTA